MPLARDLWNLISESIWKNGEPGVLYWDRIQQEGEKIGMPIVGVNPCGEIPLPNFGSCNLGSINLANVDSIEELKDVVSLASKFLVCGLIRAHLPYEKVARVRQNNSRIGLGLMGLHEWLLKRN